MSTVVFEIWFPMGVEGVAGSLETRLVSLRLIFRVLLGSNVVRIKLGGGRLWGKKRVERSTCSEDLCSES